MRQDNFEQQSNGVIGVMTLKLIVSTGIQIAWLWVFVSVGIPSILKAVELVGLYWGH